MSEQIHADKAEEQVSSDSGLLLSAEPLGGGGRLSAAGDADADASDTTGDDTDAGLGDADASDSSLTDADASDTDSDEADADGTDGGDNVESESGLGGENPLGINRNRPAGGDTGGDSGDARDS